MHTIKLDIDETVYDKFMPLLDLMPKGKVKIQDDIQTDASLELSKYFDKVTSEDDALLKKLAQ